MQGMKRMKVERAASFVGCHKDAGVPLCRHPAQKTTYKPLRLRAPAREPPPAPLRDAYRPRLEMK